MSERADVQERLDDLREDYVTVTRVYQYVKTAHETRPSVSDFLTTVRLDKDLALELRDSMGRTVIAATTDDGGKVRYACWEHSALSGRQSTSWEFRRDVAKTLEDRRPLVRLRENTPLAGVEAPNEFERRGNGMVTLGP